jgi:hypothetical protein
MWLYWVSLCFQVSGFQLLVKYHIFHILFFIFFPRLVWLFITVFEFSNVIGLLLNLVLLKKFRAETELAMAPVTRQHQP